MLKHDDPRPTNNKCLTTNTQKATFDGRQLRPRSFGSEEAPTSTTLFWVGGGQSSLTCQASHKQTHKRPTHP